MSQSTPIPISQWDPIETLSINQQPDGHFICSGIKNGTTTPCGYHLRGETASNLDNLLDDISTLPPRTAIHSLKSLADASLCQYHKSQARVKVMQWSKAIDVLPPYPGIAYTPPSPSPTPSSHRSSQPSGGYIHVPSFKPERRSPTPRTVTVEQENELLKAQNEALKDEIDRLTREFGDLRASASTSSSRKGFRGSLFRSGS